MARNPKAVMVAAPKKQRVHQVSDWCSGVAIKMGRRQGGPSGTGDRKEHI
jgi:hypothetical protein